MKEVYVVKLDYETTEIDGGYYYETIGVFETYEQANACILYLIKDEQEKWHKEFGTFTKEVNEFAEYVFSIDKCTLGVIENIPNFQ